MTKTDRPDLEGSAGERAAYDRTDLLDSAPEEAFDRVTRLVARLLDVPVSLVTILDEERQFFKAEIGLPEPWHGARETPLTHSFCQHVVRTGQPLVIDDARADPLVCDNLAIRDLGVEAYLGFPLRQADGTVIGSLCAIDSRVHAWTAEDRAILADLAGIVETELFLRNEIRRREAAEVARTLLMRELEHRVKNSFAKVQAIVSLSLRGEGDAATIRKSVTQRIAALARTQSLLADVGTRGTTVGEILTNELLHYEGTQGLVSDAGRLDLRGDVVKVTEEEAVSIGMVAHELATNAAKYGAIAQGGSIVVSWAEAREGAGRRLRLEWREAGLRSVEAPSRKGFGSTLLETLVVRQHGGSIERSWPASGLVLVADMALADPG